MALAGAATAIRIARPAPAVTDPRAKLAQAIRVILQETGGAAFAGFGVKLMMENVSPEKAERVLAYLRTL